MRQVRTCDFCGDDATGLYEPLPDSVPESPRLLLCDGCRTRLGSIIDPLVAQIEGGAGSRSDEQSGGRPRLDRTTEAPDGGSTPDRSPAQRDAPGPEDSARPEPDPRPENPTSSVVGESRDAGGRSQKERGGTPHGYRKVMRLLENRQLPMAREDAVQLAAEAYELDPTEVAKAIDHAVEYDRLREVDGELKQ